MIFTISLTNNKDFLRLYNKGKFVSSKECVIYYLPNNFSYNRLGITTSKKIGNAVIRNRARRIIKAAYQHCELKFPIGYDIVIIARKDIYNVKSDLILKFFEKKVLKRINNIDFCSQKSKKE